MDKKLNLTHRYLASGGYDSIVNIFDLNEWICSRTIASCEYVAKRVLLDANSILLFRNAINALSFSFDGEYLAIASTGSYIDIVRDVLCFVSALF